MDNNKLGTKPHYLILDGLRGVAAIIVAFFHLAEPLASSHLDNVVNHGGWTLNAEQVRVGLVRTIFPFFAGLLLSRVARPVYIKNAFLWCSLLIAAVLFMPRIGGAEHLWMNGFYEAFCIIIVFPLIVYIGASGVVRSQTEDRICTFLGNLSYPLYMMHYVLVYFYVAWVSNHSGVTLSQAWPYALLTFSGAILLAYASLKLYDEPVRAWLRRKLK